MPEVNWGQLAITAGASLLGGGAMGALINNYFTKVRSRVQPVHYRIGTDTRTGLTGPNDEYALLISLKHGDKVYDIRIW